MLTTLFYAALIVAALIVLVCLHLWGPILRDWWSLRRRRRAALARLMEGYQFPAVYTGPDWGELRYGQHGFAISAPERPEHVRFVPSMPRGWYVPAAHVRRAAQ